MADIKLRSYQYNQICEVREAMKEHKRIIYQADTGTGKGVVVGYIAAQSQEKGSNVLIVSHRTEIQGQNGKHINRFGIDVDFIDPHNRYIPKGKCNVAMAQTLRQRVKRKEWCDWLLSVDLLLVDECHRSEFDFLFNYIRPTCYVIGFSATPARMGRMTQLGLLYSAISVGISTQELIDMNYLVPIRHFTFSCPSLDGVTFDPQTGDYKQQDLATRFEDKQVYAGLIENYLNLKDKDGNYVARGRKTICFCVSSKQAIETTKLLVENGISAKYLLSGKFPEDEIYSGEREYVIQQFRDNKFTVLVNVEITTAGFDMPDITCVITNFATVSLIKYKQTLGRGARIYPGKKECIHLDFGGNCTRLGTYSQHRDWHLWHSTSEPNGVVQTKKCKNCGREIPISLKKCCFCDYVFPTDAEIRMVELQELLPEDIPDSELTLQQWVAKKKLQNWSNRRILVSVCHGNPHREKAAFMETIEILRNEDGTIIQPSYWYSFAKYILKPTKVKKV